MFRNTHRLVLAFALAGAVALPCAAGDEGADFSGTWVFNEEESELPARGGGDADDGSHRRRSSQMTITQTEGELKMVVTGPQGPIGNTREQVLRPGAGPQQTSTFTGEITVESHWDQKKLVVKRVNVFETRNGDLVEIEQNSTWELSDDGRQLIQKQRSKRPRGTTYSKIVYDKK